MTEAEEESVLQNKLPPPPLFFNYDRIYNINNDLTEKKKCWHKVPSKAKTEMQISPIIYKK